MQTADHDAHDVVRKKPSAMKRPSSSADDLDDTPPMKKPAAATGDEIKSEDICGGDKKVKVSVVVIKNVKMTCPRTAKMASSSLGR
eukprot:7177393-Pyramimonas_sp.AAC.1